MSAAARGLARFITFEGIEGSGKSTQLSRLAASWSSAGVRLVVTREPGGTELGRRLRALLLHTDGPPISATAELLLYATDRAQHLEEVVLPALGRGELVLCDRYLDATLAYQGFARGLGGERILELHARPPLDLRPDRTVLLDLDPEVALARARARNTSRGVDTAEGRFESESLAFHRAVREGYLALAKDDRGRRIRVVDAAATVDEVARRVEAAVDDLRPIVDRP